MLKSAMKRSAPSLIQSTSKKSKGSIPVVDSEAEEDFTDEDSEENEFDLEDNDEDEDSEGNEFNEDDGEDLMANVGNVEEEEEEEESDEEDEDEDDTPAPAPTLVLKKTNVRNSKGAVPLTAAQLRALAFAELTASPVSTLIATQVTSFLAPITPPTPATSPLHPLLKSLHAHLTSLPDQTPISLDGLRKKGKVVPGAKGNRWDKVELNWTKPHASEVRICGSWAWGGATRAAGGEYMTEMAIGIPVSLLQPKDYLSPRFLTKSTHYLITLASNLPSTLGPVALSYVSLTGSQGWALEIRSASAQQGDEKVGLSKIKGAVLRLRCVWGGSDEEVFASSRMNPLRNLIRPATASDEDTSTTEFPATPIHASSLLLSSLPILTHHLKHFHSLSISHPSFSATVRLLQAWATHRSFDASLGLTNEFWAWCVARTLDWGASSSSMNSGGGGEIWAGWRKTVEWLAGIDWIEGMWFRVDGDGAYSRDDFRSAFKGQPLFVDPTGKVNLAAGIDISTLEMLKQDAKTAIALLMSAASDEEKFDGCFHMEIKEVVRFDNFAQITIPASLLTPSTHPDALDYATPLAYTISSISATLRRALGTRTRAFQLVAPPPIHISATDPVSSKSKPAPLVLSLGLLIHAAEAGRIVDQGPSAEDEAACAEFRAFWGEKSELRRFKDGQILESVVWELSSEGGLGQQRNKIVAQVVRYILGSRHGIPASDVEIFAGTMDHLIVEPEGLRRAIYLEDSVASSKGFGNIMGVYDALVKDLTGLADLPLAISSVSPSSPGLRYSTVFTPSPRRLKEFGRFPASTKYIEIHDIILTMESSGRWPDDLEGVQKIKAAFLARIAEGLSSLHTIVTAQLAFDLSARPIDDNVSLEILTSSGYAFRARIFYERSLLLLRSRAQKLGLSDPDQDLSRIHHNERFIHAPRHHAAIATLQHHFTSYSPTVRLVKRWFSAHMLSPYFDDPILELFVVSVFLDSSASFEPPASGPTGLARVMEKLATWKWKEEFLVVPMYTFSIATTSGRRADFPTAKKAEAKIAFEERRANNMGMDEGGAWFIATEEDVEGKVWGRKIGKVVAGRVKGLAKATLKAMNGGVLSGGLVVEQLFSPPLGDYAFLLHLNSNIVPRHFQSIAPDPSALVKSRSPSVLSGSVMGDHDDDTPRLAFDPVATLLRDLERVYPSVFLLFYSQDGGSVIGGIWNPSIENPRPWKVGLGFPVQPVILDATSSSASSSSVNGKSEATNSNKAKVQVDKQVILKDLERLGKGLIVRVELLR